MARQALLKYLPPRGFLHRLARLFVELALAGRFAFVVELLALHQGDFGLDVVALEVHRQGNDGEPFGFDPALQFVQLVFVQQQLARPFRLVVFAIAMAVVTDVDADQESLATAKLDETVLQLDFAAAGRLHFGAGQGHAGFEAVVDVIFMQGLPIAGNRAAVALLRLLQRRSSCLPVLSRSNVDSNPGQA